MNESEYLQLGQFDLINFSILTNPKYKPNWHHLLIADFLEKVERGEVKRLIIEMPPRRGKSQLSSINFPAWYLGRNPDKEIITASYSGDLASDFGQKTRDLINDELYQGIFSNITLREDSKAKNKWMTKDNGSYISVGVGGAATGRGADCLDGDTLIKTKEGLKRIKDINVGDMVLSMGEDLCYNKVVATRKTITKKIYEITSGKNIIRSTGQHRYFVQNKGYKQAKDLQIGDKTISFKQDMQELWKEEEWKRSLLQRMLRFIKKGRNRSYLQFLWKEIFEKELRNKKSKEKRTQRLILFIRMLTKASFYKKQKEMYNLWKSSRKENKKILQRMQENIIFKKIKRNTMSFLQEIIYATFSFNKILFNGMQERLSFSTNVWGIKSKLQTWDGFREISKRISKEKISSKDGRKQKMYSMWSKGRFSASSSRLQSKEQQRQQSSISMQTLSFNTSSIKKDTISSITTIKKEQYVYDIQVENNNNFFANNILVHNCLLIDDPFKNREDANSETIRNKVWDWFTSTAFTRLSPNGVVILIQTRWHKDDLAGRIKEMDDDNEWTVLSLPEIAERDEEWNIKGKTYTRNTGDILWPQRFNLENVLSTKKQIGIYEFNSLYQQNPISSENQVFKRGWFDYYKQSDIINKELEVYAMVDPAGWDDDGKKNKNGDNTSIQVIGKERNASAIYKLEDLTDRLNPRQVSDYLFYLKNKYGENLISVGIEKVAYQKALKFYIEEQMRLKGEFFNIVGLEAKNSKELRIQGLVPYYENRIIKHRNNGLDNSLEDELLVFPFGKHDDRIDALAYMFQVMEHTNIGNKKKSFTPDYKQMY